ncbi:MAG: orotate phosphoribosyltransferase [Hyperthermus sp.]|nr:MAG: orotate phosphoribosyltransferase [Hyperthermus sp.]
MLDGSLLASVLQRTGSIKRGRFRLSSGIESTVYIDLRRLLAYPRDFSLVLSMLNVLLSRVHPSPECIIGVATGGIPWAVGLGLLNSMPVGYVRASRKGYGLSKSVEGVDPCRAVVVDDVATTGGSLEAAVNTLREEGYRVDSALVIVDRGMGAAERLRRLSVRLYSLTSLDAIIGALEE